MNRLNNNKTNRLFFRWIPIFFIPFLVVLSVISTHSKRLINLRLSYIIYIILSLLIYLFVVGLFLKKNKEKEKKKIRYVIKILIVFIITIYITGCFLSLVLLYGPSNGFRNWFISTGTSTMSHRYLVEWFYNEKEINKVIKGNYIVEVNEETDKDLINVEAKKEEVYANEYEKQVLEHEDNEKYKIIELEVNDQRAFLAVIYDPSKLRVATSRNVGKTGQYVTSIAEANKALLAINGGGFSNAPGDTTGGCPTGVTIANGKVITDNTFSSDVQSGGLIGLTYDNKLVMIKQPTANKALEQGVRDGVSWGPFLIVNGKKAFIKGNGGWGYAARTAIGQRSDGIILLLVVNSNSTRTKGADMVDLTEIMSNYGAINAANLDGGTSTVMVLPKNEALKYNDSCKQNYCYINDPIDANLKHKTRGIPTTFILTE